tara:strand:- start:21338 stop:21568 length:231 start_codon:yes stop_codon:yes gene_type:complete
MEDSIKNRIRESLGKLKVSEDGASVLDNDVWTRLEGSLEASLKNLAREYSGEFEGGAQEAFGHILEIANRRYGTDY